MITKDQIKEYILSLGFIDNTKWPSHGEDHVWMTWPGACNNAFLLSKDYLRIFSYPEQDKNGQLSFAGGASILYDRMTDFNLDMIKEFRDKIIRFKKEQRFKKIEEL